MWGVGPRLVRAMSVFTQAELDYLAGQRLARLATASPDGEPDVSAVGFGLDGDTIVSGGIDLTKTIRYRHLQGNPRATIVIDDLASVDPWRPRGIKVRGRASLEEHDGSLRIRIVPETIWSWGLNVGAKTHFAGRIEKRTAGA
jgi:pyridoxamine 5'-phosphate oxidase family protein